MVFNYSNPISTSEASIACVAKERLLNLINLLEALRKAQNSSNLVKIFFDENLSQNKAQIDSECALLHSYAVSYNLSIQVAKLTNVYDFEFIENLPKLQKPNAPKAQIFKSLNNNGISKVSF